jgi:cyclohexanecarboxyl-CoA dehydrogenase
MTLHPMVLTPEHLEFRDQTRRFARAELMDGYLARAHTDDFPLAQVRRMGEVGLLNLLVPEELGGQGADLLTYGLVAEEISYADPNCAFVILNANLVANLLSRHESPALQDWGRRIGTGETLSCLGLTEPSGGSDAKALKTRAECVDGGWVLSGEKTSISMATAAEVGLVVAQAGEAGSSRSIGAFLVPLDGDTVARQRFRDLGTRPLGRGSLMFDRTFVPDELVVAPPGEGLSFVLGEFDLTRTVIALMATGPATRALEAASAYAREREAFGKPIAANQGVSFVIAEHSTYVEAVRALALQTLGRRQAGQPHTKEAAMLKWWAPQVAFNAIQASIVLHGHVAWSDELPLQSLLRDVSGYQIGDGTPQIQKLVIARHLVGSEVSR